MSTQPTLSLVVPLYNEQDNINPLLNRVEEGLHEYTGSYELILVDDGSSDHTVAKALAASSDHDYEIRVLELQRNFGQTAAMQAGIDAATGELIVTLDGDLQNDPHDIPRMVDALLGRDLDLLVGWREKRKDKLFMRKIPSWLANRLIGKITGVKIHDYGCSLKVYRASVIKQVKLLGEMHRFIPAWVAAVAPARRIGEMPVTHHARIHGASKYGISRSIRVVLDLLSVLFFMKYRARPGHFFGGIGMVVGFIGGMILVYLGFDKFILGNHIGARPALLIGVVMVITASQFLTTGILAELMSRTYYETSNTTHYVVREAHTNKP
jgi:glycosyltransferase involved in cell wall biosynthesis|tara:strand:- start:81340 stop:82311 length:972 start_codon:yes stop_codon:yes gene_type:complete